MALVDIDRIPAVMGTVKMVELQPLELGEFP